MAVRNEDSFSIESYEGLNVADSQNRITDRELTVCHNLLLRGDGTLYKRPGMLDVTTFAGATVVLPLGWVLIGAKYYCILTTDAKTFVYKEGDPLTTWTEIIPHPSTAVTQYLLAGKATAFIGTNQWGIYSWQGTGLATAVAGSPNCSALVYHKSRLWAAGINVADQADIKNSQLSWSDAGAPQTWAGASIWNVNPGDGDELVAIVPYSDRLMLFKQSTTWNFYLSGNPETWQLRLFSPNVGCTGRYGYAMSDTTLYFIGLDGIYVCDGVEIRRVSKQIDPLFANRPRRSSLVYDFLSVYRNEFVIASFQDITNTLQSVIYRTDSAARSWATWSSKYLAYPTSLVSMPRSNGEPYHFLGQNPPANLRDAPDPHAASPAQLVRLSPNAWADGPLTIKVSFATKRYAIDRASRYKRNKYSYVFMNHAGVDPKYWYEIDSVVTSPKRFVDFTTKGYSGYKLAGAGYFREVRFFLEEDSSSEFEIQGLNLILQTHRNVPQAVQ